MIKTIRRGAAALLAAIVLTGSLTGCGTWSNTKIVLTTGLTGDQLFKVGKSVCTLPEAMIYVMDYKQQYENAYGVEMWEHDFGGVTLEEYVKDTIIAQLASVKAVTLLAKENNVTLSDAEKEKISQAAEEYYSALTDEQKKYMKVEKSDVEDLYAAHVLSKKVYTEITKDVNTEVSDDEARIITIQQIRLDSLDNAEIVKARLDEGKDFGTVAAAYNRDSQTTVTLGRGEKEAAYEEAAFSLENDQISDVIETTGRLLYPEMCQQLRPRRHRSQQNYHGRKTPRRRIHRSLRNFDGRHPIRVQPGRSGTKSTLPTTAVKPPPTS